MVEIGGNTEPLNKALQGVNKTSKDLQQELRQVERLLKLDPANTTLLSQKQELLSKAVQNTADKVNTLAKAQKQVEESFNLKKISEEQYRAFQREVITAENELKNVTEAADSFTKALSAENRTMQTSNSMLDEFRQGYKSLDTSLSETKNHIDKTSQSTKNFNTESENSKGKLGAMTVAFGNLVANGIQMAIAKIIELTKSTREFREDFAKLETNAKMAGASMETTNNALRDLNAITGESDSNIEALSNLLQAGYKNNKLQEAVDALSGAVIKFPDTLKIESLADSLQETLATGKSTGQFQEMLGRMGISVDAFDKGLQRATKSGTEQQYVLDTLARTGLAKVNEEYCKNNSSLVDSANAQYDLNQSLAELSKILEPIVTELSVTLSKFLKENGSMITDLAKLIVKIVGILVVLLGVIAQINPGVLALLTTIVAIVAIILQVIKAIEALSKLEGKAGAFFSGLDVQVLKTTAIVMGVVAALIALAAIIAVLAGRGNDVERTMYSLGRGVSGITGSVPRYASGTNNHPGGPAIINDTYGGEIVNLPSGSQVIPHDISMAMAQGSGSQIVNVYVSADNLQQMSDVARLFEDFRRNKRAGRV